MVLGQIGSKLGVGLSNIVNIFDPEVIVTANPGCLLQLRAGLDERGSAVQVKHLAEVLDEATAE